MSNEILTPISLWQNANTEHAPEFEVIAEYTEGNIKVVRFYLNGKTTEDGVQKIYGVYARDVTVKNQPAVFAVQDFNDGADEFYLMYLAKRGYLAFSVDFAGETGKTTNHSVYPNSLSGINYINCKDNLTEIKENAKNSVYYEWGLILRYGYEYLKSLDNVGRIGGIGIGKAGTLLYHLCASVKFDSVAFLLNTGWTAYKGYRRFETAEPDFDDNMIKYVAAIEPQMYVSYINCPSFFIGATNSNDFDIDRAFDTYSRTGDKFYSAIDYSVEFKNCISSASNKALDLFLDKFLKAKDVYMPKDVTMDCECDKEKFVARAVVDKTQLKDVYFYVSEGEKDPSYRCWNKIKAQENGEYFIEYKPFSGSKFISIFAKAEYKNGFSVCSKIFNNCFDGVGVLYKSNVIYSSTGSDEGIFVPAREKTERPFGLNIAEDNNVKVKKGPMGLKGVNCFGGLLTFAVGIEKYRPKQDAMIMLDVYSKTPSYLTVKLIENYFGERKEYVATEKLTGGEFWQNVKIELNDFKASEGRPLSSFTANAIEIDAQGEYLINNLIWV